MKSSIQKIIISTTLIALFATQPALAQGSLQHSLDASKHSVQAMGHSLTAGGKLVAGVIAVPLIAVGAIGEVSGEAGKGLWQTATGDPLPVTDETVTAGPSPSQAIYQGGEK